MIKLWLKHIILDTALNNLFNGLVDAFANPVAVKLIIGEQYAMIIEKAGNRVTKYERCLIGRTDIKHGKMEAHIPVDDIEHWDG